MGKSSFRFKMFQVRQDRCAMKVCTDSCIFGSFLSHPNPKRILDIGTGTGLLALMQAQRFEQAQIDAVEVEPNAYYQAKGNFEASPWASRLVPHLSAIQEFKPGYQFDLIITNPPFFENDLKPKLDRRALARHTTTLTYEEVVKMADNLIESTGVFGVLLPPFKTGRFQMLARSYDLHLQSTLEIRNQSEHPVLRVVQSFGRSQVPHQIRRLAIRNKDRIYTDEFRFLLEPFYLDYNFDAIQPT